MLYMRYDVGLGLLYCTVLHTQQGLFVEERGREEGDRRNAVLARNAKVLNMTPFVCVCANCVDVIQIKIY